MERRKFFKVSAIIFTALLFPEKSEAKSLFQSSVAKLNTQKEKIVSLIKELTREGTNLVKKVLNGRKYEFDPDVHYPFNGGIKDKESGYQIFFHAHRPNEYGHFHTFGTDENGNLVHLIMVSMDADGIPTKISTVNKWVTGDKYIKAEKLGKIAHNFFVDPKLFKDERIIEFINNIFMVYKNEINKLFYERDEWITNYVNNNYREPFEDRGNEILSSHELNI